MDKIIDYMIINGHHSKVQSEVKDQITQGWQPLGPPVTGYHKNSSFTIIFQTMVQYDKD